MIELDVLTPDCSQCSALCCTGLAFSASAHFAESKPAGQPCHNLAADFGCGIHADLTSSGWRGCTVFECFGAGQLVTQHTFGGQNWRDSPELSAAIFSAFGIVMGVNEVRHHLRSLGERPLSSAARAHWSELTQRADLLAVSAPEELTGESLGNLRMDAGPFFVATSAALREAHHRATTRRAACPAALAPYADLSGRAFEGADLSAADLRGAILIGADLHDSSLYLADLLGADLRDARLHGADLSEALFVTQTQLNSASGDSTTRVPAGLRRPPRWA